MTTMAAQPSPPQTIRTETVDGEQHLLLCNISWQEYIAVGNALPERASLRMTYDRGRLEFMTTSARHEIYKKWLGRFVDILAEEFNKATTSAGQMTFQKEELEKGLEADDCFWILHEPLMRGKLTWDPKSDPPPDLALEIEISRNALNRMPIYAAIRVLEIWRFNGSTLRAHRLQSDGTYQATDESQFFPNIRLSELLPFLKLVESADGLTIIRQFRAWVRQIVAKETGA